MVRRGLNWWVAIAAGVLVLAFLAWKSWPEGEDEATAPRARPDRWASVREESARLMPRELEGVAIGMTREEVRRARPEMARDTRAQNTEPELWLESEDLANGARVVYAFERRSARLQRVQILSLLPGVEAIAPHLGAMNDRYGPPTGAWDCPNTGGVPTRRFTWRNAHTTISDVFLIYGGRVSLTLYVAPSDVIERSLRMSSCRPIESREALDRFPVASPDQMGAVQ